MITYLHDVTETDVWITNCDPDEVFELLVEYQARWMDHDVWADVPCDMSHRQFIFSEFNNSANTHTIPGLTQADLIEDGLYGIYRRPTNP